MNVQNSGCHIWALPLIDRMVGFCEEEQRTSLSTNVKNNELIVAIVFNSHRLKPVPVAACAIIVSTKNYR